MLTGRCSTKSTQPNLVVWRGWGVGLGGRSDGWGSTFYIQSGKSQSTVVIKATLEFRPNNIVLMDSMDRNIRLPLLTSELLFFIRGRIPQNPGHACRLQLLKCHTSSMRNSCIRLRLNMSYPILYPVPNLSGEFGIWSHPSNPPPLHTHRHKTHLKPCACHCYRRQISYIYSLFS